MDSIVHAEVESINIDGGEYICLDPLNFSVSDCALDDIMDTIYMAKRTRHLIM
jgi:hypothetical protein